jgi:hypothetical protein
VYTVRHIFIYFGTLGPNKERSGDCFSLFVPKNSNQQRFRRSFPDVRTEELEPTEIQKIVSRDTISIFTPRRSHKLSLKLWKWSSLASTYFIKIILRLLLFSKKEYGSKWRWEPIKITLGHKFYFLNEHSSCCCSTFQSQ